MHTPSASPASPQGMASPDPIAVLVNDAGHSRRLLAPLLAPGAPSTRWLLLACAPRLAGRIARWSTPDSRALWRQDWCDRLRQDLQPWLAVAPEGAQFSWHEVSGPLVDLTRKLRLQHGAGLRVLDARAPRLGGGLEPLSGEHTPARHRLALPVAATSTLSALLALSD